MEPKSHSGLDLTKRRSTRQQWRPGLAAIVIAWAGLLPAETFAEDPERRAVAFLGSEVARWNRDNQCFSCHNDGDAARALFSGTKTPFAPKLADIRATIDFLGDPDRWERNGVDAAFSDKRLARLQFASALAEAHAAGQVAEKSTLIEAAARLAGDQSPDGTWPIDEVAPVGSPATYGPSVATAMAVTTLRRADRVRFREPIARATTWVRDRPVRNVHEAFSVLIILADEEGPDRARIDEAIGLLKTAQNDDGGWGPFPRSPSEPFDSALALIVLAEFGNREGVDGFRRRGRAFLIATQQDDGGWPGTTRPAGGDSYAQRVSTSAWATMGLLATPMAGLRAASP